MTLSLANKMGPLVIGRTVSFDRYRTRVYCTGNGGKDTPRIQAYTVGKWRFENLATLWWDYNNPYWLPAARFL